MAEWGLVEVAELMFAAIFIIFVILPTASCIMKLVTKQPDEITKNNFERLGEEIKGLLKTQKTTEQLTVPIQINKGFKIIGFNPGKETYIPQSCKESSCICLYRTNKPTQEMLPFECINFEKATLNIAQAQMIYPNPEKGEGYEAKKIEDIMVQIDKTKTPASITLTHIYQKEQSS